MRGYLLSILVTDWIPPRSIILDLKLTHQVAKDAPDHPGHDVVPPYPTHHGELNAQQGIDESNGGDCQQYIGGRHVDYTEISHQQLAGLACHQIPQRGSYGPVQTKVAALAHHGGD